MVKVLLENVAQERRENIKTSKDNFPIVGLEHITPMQIQLTDWSTDKDNTFTKVFKKGDILFGRRRAYLKKAALAPFDGICSGDITVISPIAEKIEPTLLPFIIQNDDFFDFAVEKSAGSLSPRVKWEHLKTYSFELPAMEKQRELAQILWAAEETKQSYKSLLQKTDDLVKAKFEEIKIKNIHHIKIENVCNTFIDGDWIENKDQSEDGIRLIQTGNIGIGSYICKNERARFINQQTFRKLNCSEVFQGDILVSRLPDPIGRACIVPSFVGKAITAVDCTIIRLKENILPEFFIGFTLSNMYKEQIDTYTTGSTRQRISRSNLGKIIIPIPSLEEQLKFVEFAQQAEKSKQKLQKSLEQLNATTTALINENLK
jgi:type I restriction modification DNA specificity domain